MKVSYCCSLIARLEQARGGTAVNAENAHLHRTTHFVLHPLHPRPALRRLRYQKDVCHHQSWAMTLMVRLWWKPLLQMEAWAELESKQHRADGRSQRQ